jgi:multidrug efflux system membrane fusion protein
MRTRPILAVALAAALAVLVGCARKPPEPLKTPPPVVVVDRPVLQRVNDYEDFAGRTEAIKVVELKSRVTGYLKRIHFKDGQDIEEGKPLFDIDDRAYKAELGKAKAALHKAQDHLKTATDNYARVKQSYDGGGESKEKYDQTVGDLAEAKDDVELQMSAVELAETNLKFCRITAPFDGRLSKRLVDEENLIKADETLLTTIVRLDILYATFDVDERTAPRVTELVDNGDWLNKRLRIHLALGDDSHDDKPFGAGTLVGHVVFVDNQIDPGTGTLRVRAEVPNPRRGLSPQPQLRPGQFVRVRVPLGEPHEAILVPEKAIGSDQGQRFVFVVNTDNTVERRNVRVGQQYGQSRVIEDRVVTPSDRVIVEGLLRVRPGIEVNPKPAPAAAPAQRAPAPPALAPFEAPEPHTPGSKK